MINSQSLKYDTLLLFTSIIWGFAFVAQRAGMSYVGPFTFNAVRFALGSMVILPIILRNQKTETVITQKSPPRVSFKMIILGGSLAGFLLFSGASLQQVGLVYTTAGKAGFITGLYVVIVPIMGLFFQQRTNIGTWIGAFFAATGLYFLSVTEQLTISFGDFLELAGAFFWAAHVLTIGWLSPRIDSFKLAFFQYMACSISSLIAAVIFEVITLSGIYLAAIPILYGGVISVGAAYTLQVVAQQKVKPAHAAIILSLEAIFAAIGGWLILGEVLTSRGILGCMLMLSGMFLSQLWGILGKFTFNNSSTLLVRK